jgi:hypothetical protein
VLLQIFDKNHEFGYRDPSECLQLGKALGLEGTPGFSRYRTIGKEMEDWEWSACLVVDYDTNSNLYEILWPAGNRKWVY